jgi:hypothetical protein
LPSPSSRRLRNRLIDSLGGSFERSYSLGRASCRPSCVQAPRNNLRRPIRPPPRPVCRKRTAGHSPAFFRFTFLSNSCRAISRPEALLRPREPPASADILAPPMAMWSSAIHMTEAIFQTILHEDPRYFRRGAGSAWSRLRYAIGHTFWTQRDRGGIAARNEICGNSGRDIVI